MTHTEWNTGIGTLLKANYSALAPSRPVVCFVALIVFFNRMMIDDF
jgi:hypothetical protein